MKTTPRIILTSCIPALILCGAILLGTDVIWEANIGNAGAQAFAVTTDVKEKNGVRFILNKKSNPYCDTSTWNPTITYQ